MLCLKNVFKSYRINGGALPVLENFSLEIVTGAITALVGPSGCGKSTLTRLMAGLDVPDSGAIEFASGDPPRISVAFQDHGLLEWRTVAENVRLPLELRGADPKEVEINELIRSVGLRGFENAFPDQLSGGMKSRVALARALVVNAPIVLLDEPFRSLDEMTRFAVATDAIALLRERKQTVVLVTHSVSEAVRLSDMVIAVSSRPMNIRQMFDISLSTPQRLSVVDPEVQKITALVQSSLLESRR